MKSLQNDAWFLITAPPENIRAEKEKARALRKTQWWQRKISRGVCHYCGNPTPPAELTMDHVVPLIRGGRSTRGNIVAACKSCNSRKKYMLPIEWEGYLRTLSTHGPAEGNPNA
jgi:5-methylcytosine-specific restriction protein A